MKLRFCYPLLMSLIGTSIVFCQPSIRVWHTSPWNQASLVSLDKGGRILAVANLGRALLSKDGGCTFTNATTADQYFRLGSYSIIGADGYGHGIISGSKMTRLQLLTSDGGENWDEKDFISNTPAGRAEIPIWRDGNSHLNRSYLSADAGLNWRRIEIPDTIGVFDPAQVPFGYSYGRGILVRPSALTPWYQVNHVTGKMTERRDIPTAASLAYELDNGAMLRWYQAPHSVRFEACMPGRGCISLDSVSATSSLKGLQIDRIEHCNDFVVLSFIGSPLAIILRSNEPQTVDVREIDSSATKILGFACGPKGVAFRTDNSIVFIPSSEGTPTVVRRKMQSLANMILSDMKVIGVMNSQLITLDIQAGIVSIGGLRVEDEGVDKFDGYSDVYPRGNGSIVRGDRGVVLSADSDSARLLSWLANEVMFNPAVVSVDETAESARRRHRAFFGASQFSQLSENVTASGGPNGVRLEFHDEHTTRQLRSDTITFVSSLAAGGRFVVGHRGLYSSSDLGNTWQEIPTPAVGSVISSYATSADVELVGYRGFDVSVNGTPGTPISGGLYRKSGRGGWVRATAIKDNYIFSVTTDMNGAIWVVSTNALLEYTTKEDGTNTVVTQIDVGQTEIHIWQSLDDGLTWKVVHTETAAREFEPITGALTSNTHGHLIAMPRRVLLRPRGKEQFEAIDALPFGVHGRSARVDSQGRAWVAASNGLYLVDLNATVSVVNGMAEIGSRLRIAPNPVRSGDAARIFSDSCAKVEGLVYDVMGRLVGRVEEGILSTQGLSAGSYLVHAANGLSTMLMIAN